MYIKLFICYMGIMVSNHIVGQEELVHYYLEVQGSKSEKLELKLGIIDYDDNHNPKKRQLDDMNDLNDLVAKIEGSMSDKASSPILNIFIHGIWANKSIVWRQMIRNISKNIYTYDDGKQKILLSIIWDSSLSYKKGVKIARIKGTYLGGLLSELVDKKTDDQKINILCHSMGNRVFQHMVQESGLLYIDKKVISQYIAVGADLENDILEEEKPLHALENIVENITIYVHNNDRSLKISKLINNNKRLRLFGIPDISEHPNNVRMIDVSVIQDINMSGSISNHRYFYLSQTIMKDLNRILWEEDFTKNKVELGHPRKLKLVPTN